MAKFFVEIGAADFDTLEPLAKQGWHGIVVEPIPHLYQKLVEQFEPYPVEVIQAAISDNDDQVEMAVARDDGSWLTGCSHVISDNHMGYKLSENIDRKYDFNERITVECMTLDLLLINMHRVDFMKVDAEGHENNIFLNYSFRVKPTMIKVEHKHIDDKVLARKLESNGYLVWTEKDDIYGII
jgi:FkbM family methyltransferase